jgi:hypothetical protein
MQMDTFGQIAKKPRPHGKIERPDPFRGHQCRKVGPTGRSARIKRHILNAGQESVQSAVFASATARKLADRLGGKVAILRCAQIGPGGPDDPGFARHLACTVPSEQRRKDLATGEITRSSEYDKIERIDRDDT